MTEDPQTHAQPFRPRARLMLLLGDQLIRDVGIALVELVKNAYDADADRCEITLCGVDQAGEGASIVVEDDGVGMDVETVLNVWLEPGTENRKTQRARGTRTRRYGRLPLGEKGVGRFAVHKLGRRVRLVTRKSRHQEVVVEIDWREFERARYLADVPIEVRERPPEVFRGRRRGTRIEISDLRDSPWKRTRVQSVHRAISSIRSPFGGPGEFEPTLEMDPDPGWLRGLLSPEQVLEESLFRFSGRVEGDRLSYEYEFAPRGRLEGIEGRRAEKRRMPVQLPILDPAARRSKTQRIDLADHAIGSLEIDFRIFDRDPKILRLSATDPVGLGQFLDRSGGIRVYRDGVRVYDYGEPGNDWLELGARRLKRPTRRIGNNQIVGAVHLDLASSSDLIEKTNREGFVENDAFQAFRYAILFAVAQAEAERSVDKSRIRRVTSPGKKKPVLDDLAQLRGEIESRGLGDSLGPYLSRIESQYREALDRLLSAAGAGLNLAAVLHEVERGVRDFEKSLERGDKRPRLLNAAQEMARTIDGLTWLTRRSGRAPIDARDLVRQALFNSEHRLRAHGVEVSDGLALGDANFRFECSRRLMVASLMNLIDNAIYWLENKGGASKRLHLGTTHEPDGNPGIVVADNGPGFDDSPEDLIEPFFTRKPEGMGLGLHIVDEVMKTHSGDLRFPATGEISLPEGLEGAVVLLEFPQD